MINTARGAVVDQEALTDAVLAGRIRAVLDVTDPEVLLADHPLWAARTRSSLLTWPDPRAPSGAGWPTMPSPRSLTGPPAPGSGIPYDPEGWPSWHERSNCPRRTARRARTPATPGPTGKRWPTGS
jgi:hypothetical protein